MTQRREQLIEIRDQLDTLSAELADLTVRAEAHAQRVDELDADFRVCDTHVGQLVEALATVESLDNDPMKRAVEYVSLGRLTIGRI
ncbi:MAG TPA: hypothetical protein VG964_02875 [Candidatus Saccharimonadales bacterium]|nr:hypothetical protein [Candidatus Saccharimonadales bacterium]